MRSRRNDPLPQPVAWDKGHAVSCRFIYDLATDWRILSIVTELIGSNVILWGASFATRQPGEAHPWHTDIETSGAEGTAVSVWVGLENTSARTSLKLVPGSHRFATSLQQRAAEAGFRRGESTDEIVQGWAIGEDRDAGVINPSMEDGQAIFFDGRLWHGSMNSGSETRTALILQYATPDTRIRIPDPGRLEWPFRFREDADPPCIIVSGAGSDSPNLIVPAPPVDPARSSPQTVVRQLTLPLDGDPSGWTPHQQFRAFTPNLTLMNCHVSILEGGRSPHPPHQHEEEEILIMLDGRAELVLRSACSGEPDQIHVVERGSFSYYPAGGFHTIRTGQGSATYLMLKWRGMEGVPSNPLPAKVVSFTGRFFDASEGGSEGFEVRGVLEGETRYLARLHSHCSTLSPGAGYAAHSDDHDVAMVVLEGTIETVGQRLIENGIVFIPAGVPHGMANPGESPARYLVFEFHGR